MSQARSAEPLSSLMNIGPRSEALLRAVGINSAQKLREVGAVEAYLRVLGAGYPPHLMLLYAFYGAIHQINCLHLPQEDKDRLKAAVTPAGAAKVRTRTRPRKPAVT